MLSTEGIRNKEVINICDGRSMGFVSDIEIDLEKGCIEGIILPGQRNFFHIFGRNDQDYVIKWKDVKTIGEDVILVEAAGLLD